HASSCRNRAIEAFRPSSFLRRSRLGCDRAPYAFWRAKTCRRIGPQPRRAGRTRAARARLPQANLYRGAVQEHGSLLRGGSTATRGSVSEARVGSWEEDTARRTV